MLAPSLFSIYSQFCSGVMVCTQTVLAIPMILSEDQNPSTPLKNSALINFKFLNQYRSLHGRWIWRPVFLRLMVSDPVRARRKCCLPQCPLVVLTNRFSYPMRLRYFGQFILCSSFKWILFILNEWPVREFRLLSQNS
jgi:hypothetical protein